jgi:type IV pilus assembly protein PilM
MALWSHPAAVGLDIGSRMVKAVQLKKSGKQIELEKFGVAPIYPGGEKPPEPDQQRAAISKAITQALRDAGITANQMVTAVSGESIIVRYIQMPEMPEAELNNALRWEAEEYIPFQIDDVNIDSAIIGRSGDEGQKKMDVLLVCARKELITDHVARLNDTGLSAAVVDVDSFAFLNCFDLNYDVAPTEAVGLVNIGGDITTISVFMAGLPRFSRDISIGGNTMTGAIQQRLSISHSEAEAVMIHRGAPKPQQGGPARRETASRATPWPTARSAAPCRIFAARSAARFSSSRGSRMA